MKLLRRIVSFTFIVALLSLASAHAAESLVWRSKENKVDAEINDCQLPALLEKISDATGWKVYVEPGTSTSVSVKFKNLPTDEALRRLLGRVNYARTVETNDTTKLFVYRTAAGAATQLIRSDKQLSGSKKYLIPNELLVRLKKDSKLSIDELAKLLGARIAGRDDRIKMYRLQFDTEEAAKAARALLENNSEVASVESNYRVDKPSPYEMVARGGSGSVLNPPAPGDGGPVVGLIDTPLQEQNCVGDAFTLPSMSVAGNATPSLDVPTHATGMFETMVQSMASNPSRVRPVDIYGNSENTTTFELTQGIIKAVNSGANPINLSLGGTGDSESLHALIREAAGKGIVFVAAAGNEPGTNPTFPAAYPEVLAVTATGSDGKIEPYANTGSFVDVAAPGTSMICLNGQNWIVKGTSVSTAYITGLIARTMNQEHLSARDATAKVVASQRAGAH